MAWTDEEITRRLFRADEPEPAAAALVFGSAAAARARLRVERGVELWRAGLVPQLVLTGGAGIAAEPSEARKMALHAAALGVPPTALLLEGESSNTFENVRFSLGLLAARGLAAPACTLLLVSAPWHLGRVVCTLARFAAPSTRLLAVASAEAETPTRWRDEPAARRVVEAEARIFQAFVEAGLLRLPG